MPKHTLNLKLVEKLVSNYKSNQLYSIENSPTNPMDFDASAASFSLKNLKSFIDTIEKEVAKHPEVEVNELGIRFYYAAYPKSFNWEDEEYEELQSLNPKYDKLHTLIAVPTLTIDGITFDFDPYDVKTYDGSKPSGTAMPIMAENHGILYPPNNVIGQWF